ncbi:acyl-CoA dehydrogenase domain-containing protein [Sphingobium chlorophenolicum L-1]|uniref:Acyl-CoA dehydrogenase domain-containing protein n=1 Tax=Sphingobium chlorophenolicum L-1 TaxID=690566 RepID=F6F352_SPHCR|nr:acyl-CoA dehydrogenase family protein [Sphingobium chlorophenolicum]AEG50864.1 acyl-CoA dehydrogenase domain-containing protein [Sphingobium chlorophenolicum L-1]
MDLTFSAEEEAFRAEVRDFLKAHLPTDLAEAEAQGFHMHRSQLAEWHRTLHEKGWIAPNWPSEFGGPGWTPIQKYIFEVEYGLANGPELSLIALSMAGPVICRFGSPEMKVRFLDPILRGDIWFCQGFSEPQSGSDLASLKTRAVLDGDDYVVTGQKIWTTSAHMADYMITLARTRFDGKPQAGLSMILIPMDAPGVTVRPILSIDGSHNVNEVFLDDVRVPRGNLVGEAHSGWTQAKFLLNNERTHNAYAGMLKRYVARIARAIDAAQGNGLSTQEAADYRRTLGILSIDVAALEWSVLRVLASAESPLLGAAASALKVRGSELLLRAGELELSIAGPQMAPRFRPDEASPHKAFASQWTPGKADQYLYFRAATIFGGSNEIQRGIIWSTLFRN